MFENAYIGMEDKNGNPIHEGDIVAGFDRRFIVRYGIVRMERLSPMNHEILTVDVPCFHFEWVAPDEETVQLFPIVNNDMSEHDLETLEVVGKARECDPATRGTRREATNETKIKVK